MKYVLEVLNNDKLVAVYQDHAVMGLFTKLRKAFKVPFIDSDRLRRECILWGEAAHRCKNMTYLLRVEK